MRTIYDWHQGEDHIGIYRVINKQLEIFEEDFTSIPLIYDDDTFDTHGDWALRVELLCNLLNGGIISEQQAILAMKFMEATMPDGASGPCSEGSPG